MATLDTKEKGRIAACQDDPMLEDTQGALVLKEPTREQEIVLRLRIILNLEDGTPMIAILEAALARLEEAA